jgi:dimethylaniline monooxygenase (N-oxide forming)
MAKTFPLRSEHLTFCLQQISSIMYRWHPAVLWKEGYPKRDEILNNVQMIWKRYDLDKRTKFNTKIKSVTRHSSSSDPHKGGHARWVINGDNSTVYDGLVVSTGTCGEPKMMDLPGQENFKGVITHSSQLDNVDLKNKRVVIVGGGASGIEALELAVEKKAKMATILARSDKWIIPRFTLVDTLLALEPFGRETPFAKIPEFLLRKLHYRDLEDKMAPTQGFYQDTPIVNSSALQHIREKRADYLRGDVKEVGQNSISFNFRKRNQKKETRGKHLDVEADVIVIATGFDVPKIDFLPQDLFPEDYTRPHPSLVSLRPFSHATQPAHCNARRLSSAITTPSTLLYSRFISLSLRVQVCVFPLKSAAHTR